jgi:hypothetical protein
MHNPYFPFHALGYQGNPFRAVTDAEWVELAILPDSIEAVANADEPYLQILGDKGHGKTTTLLALTARFKQRGLRSAYEHLEVEADHFATDLAGLDVFLLDEAQRLTTGERHRLLTAGLGHLVLAGHEDLTPLFTRFGRTLTTVHFDTAPLIHVASVIARRLDYFALPGTVERVTISPEAIAYLHTTFGADLRRTEQVLYEVFESLRGREGGGVVEVEAVELVIRNS